MNIKVLESNNEDNIRFLIKKKGINYLIEKDYIGGTCIENYFIYKDIYEDLDWFINEDNNDKYFFNEFGSLEEAIRYIYEAEEC